VTTQVVLDVTVGAGLILLAVSLRRSRLLAGLALASGVLWFAGDAVGWLVFAHRGPLTHLALIYPRVPRVRLPRLRQATIVAAYVVAFVYPLGRHGGTTIAVTVLVLVTVWRGRRAWSSPRRSHLVGNTCAVALWSALALGVAIRAADPNIDTGLLVGYELVLLAITTALLADDRYSRWRPASLAELAVDLGELGPRSLRQAIAQTLRDPSVRIGLSDGVGGVVDEFGAAVDLHPAPGRMTAELTDGTTTIGVIQHDAAARLDPRLLRSVSALVQTALANLRLQLDVDDQIRLVEASRRRLVEVADAERKALAGRVQNRVQVRLARTERLIAGADADGELLGQVQRARRSVDDFARGLHPVLLDDGLIGAILALADTLALPVEVDVRLGRLAERVELAVYFIVAEALANVVKHADASAATVSVWPVDGWVAVSIADDGRGGAFVRRGGGLAGLRDRVDALGGTLRIESDSGTRVSVRVPSAGPD
jgi:signal transduction histidine kinase